MKGIFKPNNPSKYVGDVKSITYRSSWELKAMRDLDRSSAVEAWSSEGLPIQYFDPSKYNPKTKKRGKWRRYFPDFIVKYRDRSGKLRTIVIEVKPDHETRPPVATPGKKTRRMNKEALTFATNLAKWKECKSFCDKQGWQFKVLNEFNLGIRNKV